MHAQIEQEGLYVNVTCVDKTLISCVKTVMIQFKCGEFDIVCVCVCMCGCCC